MWSVFQAFVVFLVVATNIRWNWSPDNKMVPVVFGIVLAFLLTVGLNGLAELRRKYRVRRNGGLQPPDAGGR